MGDTDGRKGKLFPAGTATLKLLRPLFSSAHGAKEHEGAENQQDDTPIQINVDVQRLDRRAIACAGDDEQHADE